MLRPLPDRSGAKRQLEQQEMQSLTVGQQAVDFQSLSAAAMPVQRSLGAINISLEEYRYLNEKLPQFRAQKALRAREAQSPPGRGMSLGVEATALASEGMAPSIRTPTLPLEVDSPRPQPGEPQVDGDIPRRVEKPSAEIMALPLEHITTTFIGESVLPTPGLP